jgi:hypothetical protein
MMIDIVAYKVRREMRADPRVLPNTFARHGEVRHSNTVLFGLGPWHRPPVDDRRAVQC